MKKILSLLLLTVLVISGCSSNDNDNDNEKTVEKEETNVEKLTNAMQNFADSVDADDAILKMTGSVEQDDMSFDMEITKHMNDGSFSYMYTYTKPTDMVVKIDTDSDSEVTDYSIIVDGVDMTSSYDQSQVDSLATEFSAVASAFLLLNFDNEVEYVKDLDEDEVTFEDGYYTYDDAAGEEVSINEDGNEVKVETDGQEVILSVGTEE